MMSNMYYASAWLLSTLAVVQGTQLLATLPGQEKVVRICHLLVHGD